jgi:hypothetical protein
MSALPRCVVSRLEVETVEPSRIGAEVCLVALLASPSAGKPYFFCMSSGISSRRIASICHCEEPYHTESAPEHVIRAQPLDRELARVLGKVELHSLIFKRGTLAERK